MSSTFQLPTAASEGFKNAAAYDAHRPSYPQEPVNTLLSKLDLLPGDENENIRVVEVASGTGKFTESLAAKYPPGRRRRRRLEVVASKVVDGHAGELPVEDGWADGWFANEETLKEAYRVLKPGKGVGIIWNVEDYNKPTSWKATTKWEEKLNEWIRSLPSDGNPRFRDEEWKKAFQDQKLFSLPLGEQTIKWKTWLTEDALWSRINTLSQVAVLEGKEKESATKVFKEAFALGDVERNSNGEIALHGITLFVWTKKI
ncbi:putative methyltransferase [Cladorrhinum sp. PSN259]|nr:putative methyltransferase [Cladorrhinum sp. PSN259]